MGKTKFLPWAKLLLVFTIGPGATTGIADQGTGTEPTGGAASSYPGQGVATTAEELQSLVAPIALYPDALVAQAIASYWREQNKTLTGSALTTAVDSQTWDPSVKALTQFPSVLNNMAKNLSWTSQLGEDYHNQQADVMAAVQTLHEKAKAAGNLQSGARSRLSRSRHKLSSSSRPIRRSCMCRSTTLPLFMALPMWLPASAPEIW